MSKVSKSPDPGSRRRGATRSESRTSSPTKKSGRKQKSLPKDKTSLSKESVSPKSSQDLSGLLDGLSEWGKTETPSGPDPLKLGSGELLGAGRQSKPEKVTQLQEILKSKGLDLAVDGKFGPETRSAVEQYQRENDLKVDGLVGPETMASLNESQAPPESKVEEQPIAKPGERGQIDLAPSDMPLEEQFEHYQGILEANGGKLNPDGPTVLGMRGVATDGSRHNSAENTGGYNDTFVVLDKDANGKPTVQVFRGATHANQKRSSGAFGKDKYGNAYNGVAQLMPGSYDVSFNSHNYKNSGASWHVKTTGGSGFVPAYRDNDHNGVISASEKALAEQNGITADAILFHNGRNSTPSSIGCQTIIPGQHTAFTNAVGKNGFNYTLVDANDGWIPS